jgi:hypothetical protein
VSALVAVHVKVATDALTDARRRVDLDYTPDAIEDWLRNELTQPGG